MWDLPLFIFFYGTHDSSQSLPNTLHYELVEIDFVNAANLILMTYSSNQQYPQELTVKSAGKSSLQNKIHHYFLKMLGGFKR